MFIFNKLGLLYKLGSSFLFVQISKLSNIVKSEGFFKYVELLNRVLTLNMDYFHQ